MRVCEKEVFGVNLRPHSPHTQREEWEKRNNIKELTKKGERALNNNDKTSEDGNACVIDPLLTTYLLLFLEKVVCK